MVKKLLFKLFKFRFYNLNRYITIYTGFQGFGEPNEWHDGKPSRIELGIIYDREYPAILNIQLLIIGIEFKVQKLEDEYQDDINIPR